jgi:hypothetical protein
MTDDMVERVAKAIIKETLELARPLNESVIETYRRIARAAIGAMYEPAGERPAIYPAEWGDPQARVESN